MFKTKRASGWRLDVAGGFRRRGRPFATIARVRVHNRSCERQHAVRAGVTHAVSQCTALAPRWIGRLVPAARQGILVERTLEQLKSTGIDRRCGRFRRGDDR